MHVNRTVADEHSTNVVPLDGMNDSAGEHRERRRVIIVIKGEWILHGTRGVTRVERKREGERLSRRWPATLIARSSDEIRSISPPLWKGRVLAMKRNGMEVRHRAIREDKKTFDDSIRDTVERNEGRKGVEIAWIIALESLPGGELFSSSSLSSSFYEIPVISSSRISWLDLAGRRIPVTPFSRARKASRGFMVYEPPSISMPRLRFRFGPKLLGRIAPIFTDLSSDETCRTDETLWNSWETAREVYSRYLDEKSLVGNRRTGEMEEEKEAENISRIFGRRNPSWVWGRKGLEIFKPTI